jgi:hypothetical protein
MQGHVKTNIILDQYSALKRICDYSQFKINWTKNHLVMSWQL